jgi:serine/threonine protein phosphatase PrpC
MIKFRVSALSDVGRVRSENEDRYLLDDKKMYFGVADGVGGLPSGAEAAQHTLDEVVRGLDLGTLESPVDLIEVVHRANDAVRMLGRKLSPEMGIASTLTFALIRNDQLHLAHVGDSRAYCWRAGVLSPLTNDHSVENEARIRQARGEKIFFHELNRNAITRCMGQPTPPEVDLLTQPVRSGDRYLFCTDGVTRLVRDEELAAMLERAVDPETTLREIVALAIRRGGPDNATGVLLFIDAVE